MNHSSIAKVSSNRLKNWLHDEQEIALLDIREHGQYGEAHLFYAVNIPFSQLETRVSDLVPRKTTRVVVYDTSDDGMALKAATALVACGYSSVHILDGGADRWHADGYELFAGVNVPSKTFGELVEITLETPYLTAQELKRRQEAGEKLVVLDGRPFSEYQKMNIPGAVCCPNGELALRSGQLIPDDDTTVVINCAGRTRSIIGAQTLIDLGLPNPVYALQNGTQGWYLDDQALEHGADRRYPDTVPAESIPELQARAQSYAERLSVPQITTETWLRWQDDTSFTTYLLDIRTAEEYLEKTVPGAQHAPGGQLIQATDHYVAVRGARIVLFDHEGVRALVVAGWLRQMGWDAYVLEDASNLFQASGAKHGKRSNPPSSLTHIPATELAIHIQAGTTFLDIRPSMDYRQGHIVSADWANRTLLAQQKPRPAGPVVLLAPNHDSAELVKATLAEHAIETLGVNTDSVDTWRDAGLEVVATPDIPSDPLCIDYLFFVHDRHHGNRDAAKQYLKWELGLVEQIDEQERATYRLPA